MVPNCKKFSIDSLLDIFYPVGTYYETSDSNFNPNEEWGGTWVEDTKGLTTVSAYRDNETNPNSNTNIYIKQGEIIGETNHILTANELPQHGQHLYAYFGSPNISKTDGAGGNYYFDYGYLTSSTNIKEFSNRPYTRVANNELRLITREDQGDSLCKGTTHNNIQPSIGVYKWHRIG